MNVPPLPEKHRHKHKRKEAPEGEVGKEALLKPNGDPTFAAFTQFTMQHGRTGSRAEVREWARAGASWKTAETAARPAPEIAHRKHKRHGKSA